MSTNNGKAPKEPPSYTIDDKSTRDIDDAIAIERQPDGWRLLVSIADVSRLVHLDTEFDLKAKERVATRYYGSGNSPMLPRFLAEKQLSLWPGRRRSVLTVDFTLAENLTTTKAEIREGVLHSQAKLTYDEIPNIVADEKHPLHGFGVEAKKLALGLLTQRRASGALVMYDLNNGWVTTEEGAIKKFENKDAVIGYIIIQELMIRTNAEVARLGIERGVPLLFRNHDTRDAGPEREALVRAIQEAFTTPVVGLDELRKKTHRFLERATYGSKLTGHFGLNLPAYLHFTSPIRRYADLVNHRQVRAMIQNKPPPYTAEQIEEVAQHINAKETQDRQSTSDHFKDQAEAKAQRAIDNRRLDGLGAKEFERAVKVEARHKPEVSEAMAQALTHRLREGSAPLICMTVVLGEAPETPGWLALKGEIIQTLARRHEDAVSILAQGVQVVGWAPAAWDTQATGPDHQRIFCVTAQLGDHSFTVRARTSKEAKQKASVGLLALLAGVEPPTFGEPIQEAPEPVPVPPAPEPETGDNWVGRLMEHSQKHRLEQPVFTYKQEGPSHMPVIACTCKYNGTTKTAVAGAKKDAKKLAAQAVAEKLKL